MTVNPNAEIWISFKAGKLIKMIHLNAIALGLGETNCKAMALFHALTESDNISCFKFKGKRYCFKIKDKFPSLMEEFAIITNTQFHISPKLRRGVQQFVCMLYSNETITDDTNVDLVRMRLFCHKTRDVERIPPTSDALDQHLKRSIFQASIWITVHNPMAPTQKSIIYGWMKKENKLFPILTTLPLAKDVFHLDVKCTCTKICLSCKCKKSNLKWTRLCTCKCAN